MGEENSIAEENRNRELVRQWAEAYAAGKDREACDLYANDLRYIPAITPQDVIIGRDVMLNASLEFRKSEPDYTMRINDIIAEKDKVVMTWTVTLSKEMLMSLASSVCRMPRSWNFRSTTLEMASGFLGAKNRLLSTSSCRVVKNPCDYGPLATAVGSSEATVVGSTD